MKDTANQLFLAHIEADVFFSEKITCQAFLLSTA